MELKSFGKQEITKSSRNKHPTPQSIKTNIISKAAEFWSSCQNNNVGDSCTRYDCSHTSASLWKKTQIRVV